MPIAIKKDVSLKDLTTFHIGGRATYFVAIHSHEDMCEVYSHKELIQYPFKILGGGSNLLISDTLHPCVVLHMCIKGYEVKEYEEYVLVTVGAGEVWDDMVSYTVTHGFQGAELLSLIPGTVGGGVVGNIGAYGQEVSAIVHSVTYYENNQFHTIQNTDCVFGYRTSIFKTQYTNAIITYVTFKLSKTWNIPKTLYPDIQEYQRMYGNIYTQQALRDAVIHIRTQKLPDTTKIGTAGSYFKNPVIKKTAYDALCTQYPHMPAHHIGSDEVKIPAAWLIEHVCSMKAVSLGEAAVYDRHALVLINKGAATAHDIQHLAQEIKTKLYNKTGITLEEEVVYWG